MCWILSLIDVLRLSPTRLFRIPTIYLVPVDDLPEGLEVGSTTIAVVDVIGMLPDVHRQQGFESFGNGISGIGFLRNDEFTILVGCKPYPTGAEERGAFLLKLRFEGIERTEIADNCLHYRQLVIGDW